MSVYVVDASVGMKWFLPEIHTEPALRLLTGSHYLLVPDLFFPEFGNILWKKTKRGELSAKEAREVFRALGTIGLRVHETQTLLPLALDIAFDADCTVYDALYVAVAVTNDVALVTADHRLYDRIHAGPLTSHVIWIEDVP